MKKGLGEAGTIAVTVTCSLLLLALLICLALVCCRRSPLLLFIEAKDKRGEFKSLTFPDRVKLIMGYLIRVPESVFGPR